MTDAFVINCIDKKISESKDINCICSWQENDGNRKTI